MNHQILSFESDQKPTTLKRTDEIVGVIGLGYVGLPLAVKLAEKFETAIGFDKNPDRIADLERGLDATREVAEAHLKHSPLVLSSKASVLADVTCFIVAVPTPVTQQKSPDLSYLQAACATVARYLKPGDLVMFESTVYPGVTEDICAPLIEEFSGLTHLVDFNVGYSPERVNPGDEENRLDTIVKLVSADTEIARARAMSLYGSIVDAELYPCASIKVAEAAKALENTQRDVNIALMNEVSEICEQIGVPTQDVINAAATKWNFVPFTPGLVGGHCIGVDPHYLRALAEEKGLNASIIRNARRVNDEVPKRILNQILKHAAHLRRVPKIVQLGLTFKEDVPDIRNSLAWSMAQEISEIWRDAIFVDPVLVGHRKTLNNDLIATDIPNQKFDLCILAVPHHAFRQSLDWSKVMAPGGLLIDLKSVVPDEVLPRGVQTWRL